MCDIFISGLAFHKIANWSFCPRYPINLDPSNIKLNDLVFLNLDEFDNFMNIIKTTNPVHKFILITHNSDRCFTQEHFEELKPYVNRVFAINNICQDNTVVTIPIGFRDMPIFTIPILKDTEIEQDKTTLLYMNFSIATNYSKRLECLIKFKDKQYVSKGCNLPLQEFYNDLAKSKYVISPEGTGIDCHRIYESIYFNSIPIIKKTDMDFFFKNLPILIVEDWEQVTEEFLNNIYQTQINILKKWKDTNKNWLDPRYWLSSSLNNNEIPYISFSLYGNDPMYTRGMIINANTIIQRFPFFRTQIYIADDVPQETITTLENIPSVRLISVNRKAGIENMFDRFKAIDEPECSLMLVRDADSRIHDRDASCIDDFLSSNKDLHIIRDHPFHNVPILGGLWGIRKTALSNTILSMIETWIYIKNVKDFPKGIDQDFLSEVIYPLFLSSAIIHDRCGFFEPGESQTSFRKPLVDRLFCGQVHCFNENGEEYAKCDP